MISRALRNAVGKSCVLTNNLPCWQLASTFSTNEIKKSENPDNPDKRECTEVRSRLSLRRQVLPPYPKIELIRQLNEERFLPANFKTVQHGDYQFQACLEDYVQIYVSGYQIPRPPGARGGYAVYYAKDHPLNESGPIERRQELNHAKLYGCLRALKSIPHGLFSKVSFNLDDLTMTKYLVSSLRNMSENSFRSVVTGRLNKDLETNMEVNKLLRTRQDLTFRVQYAPNDISFPYIFYAYKMAIEAANEAERKRLKHHSSDEL